MTSFNSSTKLSAVTCFSRRLISLRSIASRFFLCKDNCCLSHDITCLIMTNNCLYILVSEALLARIEHDIVLCKKLVKCSEIRRLVFFDQDLVELVRIVKSFTCFLVLSSESHHKEFAKI